MIKKNPNGLLLVISGPSGSGKGSIISELLKKHEDLWLSVSCTSRPIRSIDQEGVTYHFLSKEEFEQKIFENYFLEYTNYAGNYYGTPKQAIDDHRIKKEDVLLEIEIEGALHVKELFPEAVFIFILPPSMKALKERLEKRGTDSEEKILKRFQRAYQEINELAKYNYVVVNDQLEEAVKEVEAILISEKCRVDRIEEFDVDSVGEMVHENLIGKNATSI